MKALLVGASAAWALLALGVAAQGHWQTPGSIQQPKGAWQSPGEIQKAGPIEVVQAGCDRRLVAAGDALFDFNRASLTAQAVDSLTALERQIRAAGHPPAVVEGHTDSIGGMRYNLVLSQARAQAVRDWLAAHGAAAADLPIKGYGAARPVAPNTKPDGSDNPQGRARNRRVEVVIRTCA